MSYSPECEAAACSNNLETFPIRPVLLATLLPALVGAFCALFIAPPLIGVDTANGLIAWFHYLNGGTWNTTLTIDPNNIAQSIETPVTWWPPGQYVPLGILHSLGLPLGIGVVFIMVLSTVSVGLGMAKLAYLMNSPKRALVWISSTTTITHYTFSLFSNFIGGEAIQTALWPWVCIIAWKFRKRYVLFSITLPLMLALGSYAKYSFATYGLTIFCFIWFQALYEFYTSKWKAERGKDLVHTTITLIVAGGIYSLLRHLTIPSGETPATWLGVSPRAMSVSWGFSFSAPLLQLSGADQVLGFILFKFFGTSIDEEFYPRHGVLLSGLSVIGLLLYTFLAFQKQAIERLAGISAITYCSIMFFILKAASTVALRGRHYQIVAISLIAVLVLKSYSRSRLVSLGSKLALSLSIGMAFVLLFYRAHAIGFESPYYYRASERLSITRASPRLQGIFKEIARTPNSLVFVEDLGIEIELILNSPSSARFFRQQTYDRQWFASQNRYGRVPSLILLLSKERWQGDLGEIFRSSFKDYAPEEWSCYDIDGWQIWQAGYVVPLGDSSSP